jgi:cation transport protein ChaC
VSIEVTHRAAAGKEGKPADNDSFWDPFWVFGYGSLMWDPGFAYVEARHARVFGYHRALCLLSVRNRGTPEKPGLVLSMDRGGSCHGIAFRIAPAEVERTRLYLWEREMVTAAYRPAVLNARLRGGNQAKALAFVAKPDHPQYYRAMSPEHAAVLVRQGCGACGAALDYLRNVIRHLDEMGIAEGPLHRVLKTAEAADNAG